MGSERRYYLLMMTMTMALGQPQPRQLMANCIDPVTGEHTTEKAEGKHLGGDFRCDLVQFTAKTVTKTAAVKKNLFDTAREFYELETGIYERLQSVKRPRGCEKFILFPRMLSKDDRSMSFVVERFGAPMECNHLDMCCKDMCRLLPVLSPKGFCKQLALVLPLLTFHLRSCLTPHVSCSCSSSKLHRGYAPYRKRDAQGYHVKEYPIWGVACIAQAQ